MRERSKVLSFLAFSSIEEKRRQTFLKSLTLPLTVILGVAYFLRILPCFKNGDESLKIISCMFVVSNRLPLGSPSREFLKICQQ